MKIDIVQIVLFSMEKVARSQQIELKIKRRGGSIVFASSFELSGVYKYFNDSTSTVTKKWYDLMSPEDFKALTPLIYTHVNPMVTLI